MIRQLVTSGSSESLVKLLDDLQKAREAFKPPPANDDPEACRLAIDVEIYDAALKLTFAENRVLVRQVVSDVYGQFSGTATDKPEYYPGTDKASWQELAENCLTFVGEARSIGRRASIALPSRLAESLESRARMLAALTVKDALADGNQVPIYISHQHGGVPVRYSVGFKGMAATLDERVKPPCEFKAIADMRRALSTLNGSEYLFESSVY